MLANLSQLAGALTAVGGLFLVWLPLGLVALGAVLFLVGVALEGGKK